jgi:hypothetical protein
MLFASSYITDLAFLLRTLCLCVVAYPQYRNTTPRRSPSTKPLTRPIKLSNLTKGKQLFRLPA